MRHPPDDKIKRSGHQRQIRADDDAAHHPAKEKPSEGREFALRLAVAVAGI